MPCRRCFCITFVLYFTKIKHWHDTSDHFCIRFSVGRSSGNSIDEHEFRTRETLHMMLLIRSDIKPGVKMPDDCSEHWSEPPPGRENWIGLTVEPDALGPVSGNPTDWLRLTWFIHKIWRRGENMLKKKVFDDTAGVAALRWRYQQALYFEQIATFSPKFMNYSG